MDLKWLGLYALLCLVIGGLLAQPLFLFLQGFLPSQVEYVAYSASDGFMILVWCTIIIALSMFLVFIAGYLWVAYNDALHKDEKDFIKRNVLPSSVLFIIGVVFGFYVYVNLMMGFFIQTNLDLGLVNNFNMFSIISSIIGFSFMLGLAFQIPVIIRALIRHGLIDKKKFKDNRKIAIVLVLILSAVITPTPDILSQLITGIPLYLLFELSLL